MKVLQVCAYAAPYEGNFIKSLKALGEELRKRGHELLYAFPETARAIPWCQELAKKSNIYFLPLAKARIRPATYLALRKIYHENPTIEIVHSHFELYDIPINVVTPSKIRIFWHLHDCIEQLTQLKHRILHKIQYGMLYRHAELLAVGETPMKYVLNLGFPKKHAQLFPNGIDINRINYIQSINAVKYDFLMFGWLYKIKGVDLAIKAFNSLRNDYSQARLGIICNDTTINCIKNEFDNIEGIDLLSPVTNVNDIYSETKCFLHISRAEGQSYALLEAIYAGLPIICSNISVNMFANGIPSVFMVKNEDIVDIKSKMQYILQNSIDNTIRKESSSIIKKKYSIESWVTNVLEQYAL